MNLLEQEAERLKRKYGADWHSRIEDNLKWVNAEMCATPGSVAVQEGIIALSRGLPVRPVIKKSRAYKRVGSKRIGKSHVIQGKHLRTSLKKKRKSPARKRAAYKR